MSAALAVVAAAMRNECVENLCAGKLAAVAAALINTLIAL
jgi:hypothetical protein